MYFLLIPFRYTGANIRPSDMIAGMPAMTAVSGMAHNVQRFFRGEGVKTFATRAFSIIYLQFNRDNTSPRRPPQSPVKGSMVLPSLMDIRRSHGEAVLVIYFDVESADDLSWLMECFRKSSTVKSISWKMAGEVRFAGADIVIGINGELENRPLDLSIEKDWKQVLRKVMRSYPTQGLLIQDMSERLTNEARSNGICMLDAMASLIYQSHVQREEVEQNVETLEFIDYCDDLLDESYDYETLDLDIDDGLYVGSDSDKLGTQANEYLGMLMPAQTGYHEVCKARGGQHVVESTLSLVRARILPSVSLDLDDGHDAWAKHFWVWEYLPDYRVYRATSLSRHVSC